VNHFKGVQRLAAPAPLAPPTFPTSPT